MPPHCDSMDGPVVSAARQDGEDEVRRMFEAMLGFEVWSHRLHQAIRGSAHEHGSTR